LFRIESSHFERPRFENPSGKAKKKHSWDMGINPAFGIENQISSLAVAKQLDQGSNKIFDSFRSNCSFALIIYPGATHLVC